MTLARIIELLECAMQHPLIAMFKTSNLTLWIREALALAIKLQQEGER